MAEMLGKMVSCDRCGNKVFLEYIGTSHTDGGFTRNDRFMLKPAGWKYFSDIGMQLCKDCSEEYLSLLKAFKEVTHEKDV